MHRGFTKAWRKELDSDIWQMPPIYHRVWYWIRQRVNHAPKTIPTPRKYSIHILPGQMLTSMQQVAEGVSWYENGKRIIPDKRTIVRVLEWLEFNQSIAVTSNRHGTLISLVNWDIYHPIQPSHATNDAPTHVLPEQRTMHTNKNEKKEKKEKKENPPPLKPPKGERGALFDEFWQAYPKKVGEDAARAEWAKRNVDPALLAEMLQTIEWQRDTEDWERENGRFIPNPAKWLSDGRWKDEKVAPPKYRHPPGHALHGLSW